MTLPHTSRQHRSTSSPDHESALHIAETLEEKRIWTELCHSFREAFFSSALPPLELTSTPVPVPDRLAGKPNPWAFCGSTLVNGGVLALFILLGVRAAMNPGPNTPPPTALDLSKFHLIAPASQDAAHGGGGSGGNELTDPVTSRPPRFEVHPLISPQVPLLAQPLIAVQPAVTAPPNIRLPENQSMPLIGVQNTTRVILASNGQGAQGGIGTGRNSGLGPGIGNGMGPGGDRGINGGIYTPGIGGVSSPVPIVTPEAEFSDEARRAKYQGVCMISVIVDSRGYPQDPRVVQWLGMGLDQKALEAVRQYRFKPAMKDGKPVAVRIAVEVNFRLY